VSSSSRPRPHSRSSRPPRARPSHEGESRDERKARTRRTLLDAALDLSEQESFGALSLREVTKAAGIVPTAFYRHFHDMDELGLALVDESVGSLHGLLRAVRTGAIDPDHVVRPSLEVLVEHVRAHPAHFRFLARERSGGSPTIRQAIRREIKLFSSELAIDIARFPTRAAWPSADISMLSDLLVTVIVATTEALLDMSPERPDAEAEVLRLARDQMTLIIVGATAWRPSAD
jgi:AcrR family transcriptional regulator